MSVLDDVIGVGTDHAGVDLKNRVLDHLRRSGADARDYGTDSTEPCDYPEIAVRLGEAVASGEIDRGILVCGTGIGMSIAANKVCGVRAALCFNEEGARLSRTHNDANILVLAGRDATAADPFRIVDVWRETPFSDETRHARRIGKIAAYEARARDEATT